MKTLKFLVPIIFIIVLASFFTSCNIDSKKFTPAPSEATAQTPTVQLTNDSVYTCKMHDSVLRDHAGKCPECGMNLVKQKMILEQQKLMKEGTYVKPKQ